MSDLLPCKCGGLAAPVRKKIGVKGTMGYDAWHAVLCLNDCGNFMGDDTHRFRTKEDAAKAWNSENQTPPKPTKR